MLEELRLLVDDELLRDDEDDDDSEDCDVPDDVLLRLLSVDVDELLGEDTDEPVDVLDVLDEDRLDVLDDEIVLVLDSVDDDSVLVLELDSVLEELSSSSAMIASAPEGNEITPPVVKFTTDVWPVTPRQVFVSTAWQERPSGSELEISVSVTPGVSLMSSTAGSEPTS